MATLLGEMFRNVVDWRELLTPKFWEYRRANGWHSFRSALDDNSIPDFTKGLK